MLQGPVHDEMAGLVTAQLLFLEAEDPERAISLYINSPGGSVTAGLAIYDTMQYIRAPVGTLCLGQAADIAIVAKEILKTREKLNKIYVSHTGKDVEAIERVMDRDTYFTAEEAKEFGVVDEVVAARERPGKVEDEEPSSARLES